MGGNSDFVIENGILKKYTGRNAEVVIPEGIIGIDSLAFSHHKTMTRVVIPEGVVSIGGWTFHSCFDLTSVVLPKSLRSIGTGAFLCCKNLTDLVLPECLDKIGSHAFRECGSLTDFAIPIGVKKIEAETFYACSHLANVIIPDSVVSIGDAAFANCVHLTSVTIPQGVLSIGKAAFDSCGEMVRVHLPDSMTSIGEFAFNMCQSLTGVALPEGITRIEESTFDNCHALTHVEIPDGVEQIGKCAFHYCESLEHLELPASVKVIEHQAFNLCWKLNTLIYWGDTLEITGEEAFPGPLFWGFYREPSWFVRTAFLAPNLLVSKLNKSCWLPALKGFLRMEQEGWKIPPKVRADYLKCMKKYRAELYKALFETPGLLSFMKREKLIPLEDIAGLLKKEAVHEDRIAELMDYQEQAFSPEEREAYEREKRQTKQILATGVLPVPIAKKFWRYKQVEDGTIRLMHYLGNEAEVKIPSEIGGVPVASLGGLHLIGTKIWSVSISWMELRRLETMHFSIVSS